MTWLVYYDQYRDHRYGAMKSRDLKSWQEISADLSFPADHRHGSVLRISATLAQKLSELGTGRVVNKPETEAARR